MGLFDRSAFPEHLDTQEEVDQAFPDDSQFAGHWWGRVWKWLNKATKHWEAFGPRSPRGVAWAMMIPAPVLALLAVFVLIPLAVASIWWPTWHWWYLVPFVPIPLARKWRPKPFVIFAMCGKGSWRLERLNGGEASAPQQRFKWMDFEGEYFLSRIQYWTRWHFAILWPLCFQAHRYTKAGDVLPAMGHGETDGKLWGGYFGIHFDLDWIYWFWSVTIGKVFK